MTTILDRIIKTVPEAPRITLYGKPGVGKSTLASCFPDPLFLLTEKNGVDNISSLPVFTSYVALWDAIKEIHTLDIIPFKTIVIDSISKLDHLVIKHVLKNSPLISVKGSEPRPPQTLAEALGGYGAGYEKAASLHRALKFQLDKFQERGITVIYIGHVEIKKYKSPESEDYDIISINLNSDKSRAVYIDDVDAVLYCKNKSFTVDLDTNVKNKKKTIVKSTGTHVIIPNSNEVHVSKNRFKMPVEIPMTYEALAQHIPFYKGK